MYVCERVLNVRCTRVCVYSGASRCAGCGVCAHACPRVWCGGRVSLGPAVSLSTTPPVRHRPAPVTEWQDTSENPSFKTEPPKCC